MVGFQCAMVHKSLEGLYSTREMVQKNLLQILQAAVVRTDDVWSTWLITLVSISFYRNNM